MNRIKLSSDDFKKVKILGSGNFGDAFQCEITNKDVLKKLQDMSLIDSGDNNIVIKELKTPPRASDEAKILIEKNYLDEIEKCEYLYDVAANRQKKNEISHINDVHYNLSHGIEIDGNVYLASRLEGIDIYKGSAKDFFKEFSETPFSNDILIYAVDAICQIKMAIKELQDSEFLHLDIAARNVFISKANLLDNADETSPPIKIEVKLGDFGTGILPHHLDNNLSVPVSEIERVLAPRWLDHDARSGDQSERFYSYTTDLCGFRTTIAELLMYVSDQLKNEIPWYHYPIEQLEDKTKINHYNLLLENKSDRDRFRILCNSLKIDESIQPTLAIFYEYLISPPKRTDDIKQSLINDQNLFEKAIDHFFIYYVNNRINEINVKSDDDKHNARVTFKKLLELPVSDKLKNSELFEACEKLANKEDKREKHIKTIKGKLKTEDEDLKNVKIDVFKPVLGERSPSSSPQGLKGKEFESQRNLQNIMGKDQKIEAPVAEEKRQVKHRSGSMKGVFSTSTKKLKAIFTQKSGTPSLVRNKPPQEVSEPNKDSPISKPKEEIKNISPILENKMLNLNQEASPQEAKPYWQNNDAGIERRLSSTAIFFQNPGVTLLENTPEQNRTNANVEKMSSENENKYENVESAANDKNNEKNINTKAEKYELTPEEPEYENKQEKVSTKPKGP